MGCGGGDAPNVVARGGWVDVGGPCGCQGAVPGGGEPFCFQFIPEMFPMINKDYIMRIVERLGRALARILYMRQANQNEEALIYIDDLFMRTLGIGSGFINSVSDEMLLAMISPL